MRQLGGLVEVEVELGELVSFAPSVDLLDHFFD